MVQMDDVDERNLKSTVIHEENLSCSSISKGEDRFLTSKHIGLRYNYLKESVDECEIKLEYVETIDQLADVMAKEMSSVKFKQMMNRIIKSLSGSNREDKS